MAGGAEMLLNAMFKMMGVNPAVFIAQLQEFIKSINEKIGMFMASARTLNEKSDNQIERLDRIEAQLALILAYQQGRVLNHGESSINDGQPNGYHIQFRDVQNVPGNKRDGSGAGNETTERNDASDTGGGNRPANGPLEPT